MASPAQQDRSSYYIFNPPAPVIPIGHVFTSPVLVLKVPAFLVSFLKRLGFTILQ